MNQYVPERPEKQLETGAVVGEALPRGLIRAAASRLRRARAFADGCVRSIWSHRRCASRPHLWRWRFWSPRR